jgi:hypothetical protein
VILVLVLIALRRLEIALNLYEVEFVIQNVEALRILMEINPVILGVLLQMVAKLHVQGLLQVVAEEKQ